MTAKKTFDIIIIGGSYSGLAAAMTLGRALKEVLIIDSNQPCNSSTPYSHNFLTQDGEIPAVIAGMGRNEVKAYHTIAFTNDWVAKGTKIKDGFEIETASGDKFIAQKLIFATGIKDIMPDIPGFSECWGISVLHCPYCHGYEVRNQKTGILAHGEKAFELMQLISNWTNDLTLFTNGAVDLTDEQKQKLQEHNIDIITKEIKAIEHDRGYVQNIIFKDHSTSKTSVIYSPRPFKQHSSVPETLGCELTEEGYLKIDAGHETTVKGLFACGDNVNRVRTIANALATGTTTGIIVSKNLILQDF